SQRNSPTTCFEIYIKESVDLIPQDELLLTELLPNECSGQGCESKLKNTQGNAMHVSDMEINPWQ
ncbi:hypothetical protein GIB67_042929, partial [Kingdonia uniflora]